MRTRRERADPEVIAHGGRPVTGSAVGSEPDDGDVAVDRNVMRMARGASLNIVGAACTKLALLVITVVLSWTLGPPAVGRFAQAYALLMVLVAVTMLPFGSGAARFVAMHRALGEVNALRGAVRLAVGGTVACAVVLGALLFAFAPAAAHLVLHDKTLLVPLRLVAAALVPAALAESALAATVGFSRMRARATIKFIAEPVLRVAGVVLLIGLGLGLLGAMVALVVSATVEAVLAVRSLRRYMDGIPASATYHVRTVVRFSLVSGTAWLATNGLIWADTLILGALRSSTDVGVYTVATRIVVLATFVLAPITQAFAPRITDLYHRGERERLRHAYRVVTRWTLVLSLPAFALLLSFPGELLGLFGHGYGVAVGVTLVLAVGQLVNAATGPGGMMLNMSGRPGWSLADNSAVLVLNVALNLWLIPPYGILGAAVAWSVALTLVNVARVTQVWVVLRMIPFGVRQVGAVFACAVAMAAGLLVAHPFDGIIRLVVGGLTILGAYVLATSLLQRGSEDRLIVRMLVRRTTGLFRPQRGRERGI